MVINWIQKNWKTIVIILLVIVALAMWISNTKGHWFSRMILEFFDDWSIALGAGATLTLAIVAFMTLIEERKARIRSEKANSLDRISRWAINIISTMQHAPKTEGGILDINEFKANFLPHITQIPDILADTTEFPDDFKIEVNNATNVLLEFYKEVTVNNFPFEAPTDCLTDLTISISSERTKL